MNKIKRVIHAGNIAPENKYVLWVDTDVVRNHNNIILKMYFNGDWVCVGSIGDSISREELESILQNYTTVEEVENCIEVILQEIANLKDIVNHNSLAITRLQSGLPVKYLESTTATIESGILYDFGEIASGLMLSFGGYIEGFEPEYCFKFKAGVSDITITFVNKQIYWYRMPAIEQGKTYLCQITGNLALIAGWYV